MCVQGRMPSARSLSVTHQSSLRHGAHHGIHFIERKPGLCPCWATLSQDPSQEGERCSRASSLGQESTGAPRLEPVSQGTESCIDPFPTQPSWGKT